MFSREFVGFLRKFIPQVAAPLQILSTISIPAYGCTVYTTLRRDNIGNICNTFNRGRILGRNWDKVVRVSSLLFKVTSTNGFYSPSPPSLSKSGLKMVCNVNIVYGNLKSEKPQRNCTFMNSSSGDCIFSKNAM